MIKRRADRTDKQDEMKEAWEAMTKKKKNIRKEKGKKKPRHVVVHIEERFEFLGSSVIIPLLPTDRAVIPS